MKLTPLMAAAALLAGLSVPAAAQNTTEAPPATPPPVRIDPPPAPPASRTPAETPAPEPAPAPSPPPETVVVPQPAPTPIEPVTIDPDIPYPNGFADPADPFANDMAISYRERRGFDWGLLGLLGLLGLIPLFLDRRGGRVVYVERDDDLPRRTVRRERIEEDEA